MKKYYPIFITSIVFTILSSSISPVVGQQNATASPRATASTKASATPTNTKAASSSAAPKVETSAKTVVYRGEISATPSAIGKFLIKVNNEDKNVDTNKTTKVYTFERGKTLSTVAKLKVGDKAAVIGEMTADNKALLAKYVLVFPANTSELAKKAIYGTVSSRETTDTDTFILQIKSPSKDEKEDKYLMNNNTQISVKDIETPKMSDIKIGDRVTLTYTEDTETGTKTITRIYAIPGRAAGLLRDIRESEDSKETKSPTSSPSVQGASTKATASVKATTTPRATATPKATATVKPTATPRATKTPVPTPEE